MRIMQDIYRPSTALPGAIACTHPSLIYKKVVVEPVLFKPVATIAVPI
jgi:hypothetical protein